MAAYRPHNANKFDLELHEYRTESQGSKILTMVSQNKDKSTRAHAVTTLLHRVNCGLVEIV